MPGSPLWLAPPAIKWTVRLAATERPRILDVGCGNGSPSRFKRYSPDCEYHGLDRNDELLRPGDLENMHRFYQLDLETDSLASIPDNYFDAICLSHIIEHLSHAENALERLARKLKPGGVIYVEYPGARSLKMPKARQGFLNFYDDPTHVRVYTVPEVSTALQGAGCSILRGGVRRDGLRLFLTPFLALRGLILHGDIWSGRLWDFFGIAEVVIARRNVCA